MTTPVAATQRVVYDTIQHIGNWVASFFSRYMAAVGKRYGTLCLRGWVVFRDWGLGRCDGYLFLFVFLLYTVSLLFSSGPFGFYKPPDILSTGSDFFFFSLSLS